MGHPHTLTADDASDANQSAVGMALRFEVQRLSVIDHARVELALGEHASADIEAAAEAAMEHVSDAVAAAVGVLLVSAGMAEPVG